MSRSPRSRRWLAWSWWVGVVGVAALAALLALWTAHELGEDRATQPPPVGWGLSWTLLGIGGLCCLAQLWLARALLLRPIDRLRERATRLAAGAASLDPLPIPASAEAGAMVEAFNAMVRALHAERERLSLVVEERTRDLERLNRELQDDLAARRQTEQALRDIEARYRLIAEHAGDVIWVLDVTAGRFTYVSPSVLALRGYTAEEVMAAPLSAALTEESARYVAEALGRNIARLRAQGGKVTSIDRVDQPRRDGSVVRTEATTTLLFNAAGGVEVVGVSRDITARLEAEEREREARDRFQKVFDASPDATLITRASDGLVVEVNQAFLELTGYQRTEAIGQTTTGLGLWHDPVARQRVVEGLGVHGAVDLPDGHFNRRGGVPFIGSMSSRLITLYGEPHVLSVVRDVTERRRVQAEVRLGLALERVRNEVLQMNLEADWGRVFVALQTELRVMISPFDACAVAVIDLQGGTTTFHHVTPEGEHVQESYPRLWPAMRQALLSGQPVYRPTRGDIASMADELDTALVGAVVDVPFSHGTLSVSSARENAFSEADTATLQRFAPVLSEAQRRLLDITERQRLAAEVEQQRVQALEVRRLTALGEMAAGVAHELNQPLNGIRAFAEGLLYGIRQGWSTSGQETIETLGDIVGQVDRITSIVDHMRTFARDTSQVEPAAVRLSEVIDGALKLVGAQLRSYGVEVAVDIPAEVPRVLGNANQIEQVVLNLLANARDAVIAHGGRAESGWRPLVRMLAKAGDTSAEVCLGVEDNGGGVPADIVDRVFDPFFTTKDVGKGTGLGLAIAREIVVKHGGSLTLVNRPGVGATFWMHLPAAPPSAPANPIAG